MYDVGLIITSTSKYLFSVFGETKYQVTNKLSSLSDIHDDIIESCPILPAAAGRLLLLLLCLQSEVVHGCGWCQSFGYYSQLLCFF